MKAKACRICGRVQPFHFCRDIAPGNTLTCKVLRLKQTQIEKKARERQLGADLNGGIPIGERNKDLTTRLRPLVLRSYAEVGAEMGLSAPAVRLIELRALSKIRAALMPFKKATSGGAKVTQVTVPIASLED